MGEIIMEEEYDSYENCNCYPNKKWWEPLDHIEPCDHVGERDWLCDHLGDAIENMDALWEEILRLKDAL